MKNRILRYRSGGTMPSPAQLAALDAGRTGGDRWADKRAIVNLIAATLEANYTDLEVREAFGFGRDRPVTVGMRQRMARAKAPAVYDAIMGAFRAGASEELRRYEYNSAAGAVELTRGGLLLPGIARIGLKLSELVAVGFTDDWGNQCSEDPGPGKRLMYKRETYKDGYYAALSIAMHANGTWAPWFDEFIAAGWFVPWWAASPVPSYQWGLVYGPVPDDEVNFGGGFVRASIPWPPSGGNTLVDVTHWKLGSRNYGTGKNEAWAYLDEEQMFCERMVRVRWARAQGDELRLVCIPSGDFLAETSITPNE